MNLYWYKGGVKNAFKIIAAVATLAAFATSALAVNLTGTWHGKVVLDAAVLAKLKTPQQKAMIQKMISSMQVSLTLNANKTYNAMMKQGAKSESDNGTWTQSGSTLTLTPGPKSKGDHKPQNMTISGNTLVMQTGRGGKVVFTK